MQHLLHQNNTEFKTKGIEISLQAKEIGFQLLFDDFEVQVIDSLPPHKENDQFNKMVGAITSIEHHGFEFFEESTKHSISMKKNYPLKLSV